jgi:zinc transporter ZupT
VVVQTHGLPWVYSFAIGALFINVGVHLAPEYLYTDPQAEHLLPALAWGGILLGTSQLKSNRSTTAGSRALRIIWWLADTLHTLLDNLQLVLGFLHSPTTGWSQTLVLFLHELPQEMAEWSVFRSTGLSLEKVVLYNLLGLVVSLGLTAIFWTNTSWIQPFTPYLLPVILVNFSLVFYRLIAHVLVNQLNYRAIQGLLLGGLTSGLVLYFTH